MNLKLLIDLTQYRFPVAGSGIMAEREWLKSNRDTAVKFVKAAFEAIALMKKDRAAFDAAVVKWLNITDKAAQDRMYGEIELPEKPYPSVEGIRHTFVLYDLPEMRKYKPEDFYDFEHHDRARQKRLHRSAVPVSAPEHTDIAPTEEPIELFRAMVRRGEAARTE